MQLWPVKSAAMPQAATEDAAARWLLAAECSHEIGAVVLLLVRRGHDLGPVAARDRDCCRPTSVARSFRAGATTLSSKDTSCYRSRHLTTAGTGWSALGSPPGKKPWPSPGGGRSKN